jgi:hypothetical protein
MSFKGRISFLTRMPQFRTYAGEKAIYSVDMMLAYVNTHRHPVIAIPIEELKSQLEKNVWGDWSPKDVLDGMGLKKYAENARRIKAADISYPILMSSKGDILDGYHRAAKAVLQGKKTIQAHIFDTALMKKFIIDKDMNFVRVHQELAVFDMLELYAKRFC